MKYIISFMMNTYRYVLLFLAVLMGGSCSKELKTLAPDFDVQVLQSTAKVGQPIQFDFVGDANIITFYSGEFGNDYHYADKDSIIALEKLNLSFQNQVRGQGGTAPFCQADQFHVLISSDLDLTGVAAEDQLDKIKQAKWVDLTTKYAWSPLNCSSTNPYIAAGVHNIAEHITKNKRNYIAFRYTNRPNTMENGKSAIWRFQALTLSAVTPLGTTVLMTQANAGWKPVYEGGIAAWMANAFDLSASSSAVTMRGPLTTTGTYEMWCVSNPFVITDTNLGHNPGVAVKAYIDKPIRSYSYIYKKPGTYEVVFIATNANKDGRSEILRKVQVTVEP
ncbi:DUF5017 domain-containing protein [Sphingobacterium psychroaquaticum]|uniref:DUF5017 domain-containing protein n=1 Tax=Sphingobacterium psychroaquaticum TaxID=561061 RepID=UPI00106C6DBF|nr:DUF5017 domain-containing protein [Sphingobacterium psychroaquaticum]QBQ40650.1 DUF5017 domain-containing protein [Sphingobacterium psychroaquaticum]